MGLIPTKVGLSSSLSLLALSIFGCVSPRGRDKDDNLTGEDVLGNHFKWSVLELSLTLYL